MSDNWFHTSFKRRRRVTIDFTAIPSESMIDFPIMVKLDSTRIDYSNVLASGQDVRFAQQGNSNNIAYSLEKFDNTGNSFLWAKIPTINAGSKSTRFFLYYDDTGASDASSNAVFSDNYDAVWRMEADPSGGSPQLGDFSGNSNTLASVGSMNSGDLVTAQIGEGWDFDSTNDGAESGSYLDGDNFSAIQIEGWIKTTNTGSFITRGVSGDNWEVCVLGSGKMNGAFRIPGTTDVTSTTVINDGIFHYIVFNWNAATLRMFVDGVEEDSAAFAGSLPGQVAGGTFRMNADFIGANRLGGIFDEVRVSTVARNENYVKAQFLSMTDKLLSFGPEQVRDLNVPSDYVDQGIIELVS